MPHRLATACTTGDCDNPVDPNGFVRLNECDCLGEPDLWPNCSGHTYCVQCVALLIGGGETAGCVACSSASSLTIHGRNVLCPQTAGMTDRCARCGAFLGTLHDIEEMAVCKPCWHITDLQGVVEQMMQAWSAYDDVDDDISAHWEDQMQAAIERAKVVLHGPDIGRDGVSS